MDSSVPTELLFDILKKNGILKTFVIGIYLVGSRLFQCHQPNSDHDYICVVRYKSENDDDASRWIDQYGTRGPAGLWLIEHSDQNWNININVYHYRYFESLVQDNVVWILLIFFLPKFAIVYEPSSDLASNKRNLPFQFSLKKPNLKRTTLMDAEHNFLKAKKLWKEGEVQKAKKNLIHGLRFLNFGIQLAESRRITNFQAGNDKWYEITSTTYQEWKSLEDQYKPIYETLSTKLTVLLASKVKFSISVTSELPQDQLASVRFIKAYGLESLTEELSIKVTRHKDFPHLVFLNVDMMNSPSDIDIVKECSNGLLLDESHHYKVIAMPFPKVFEMGDKKTSLDWTTAKTMDLDFEKGRIVVLYHYNDSWHVSSTETPDGSLQLEQNVLDNGEIHYQYPSRRYYNAWNFFDETLMQVRKSYITNIQATATNNDKHGTSRFITLADIFWSIWKQLNYQLPTEIHHCFIFEMIARDVGITIVQQAKIAIGELIFSGAYNLNTLHQVSPEAFRGYGWRTLNASAYQCKSASDALVQARSLNPTLQRGYLFVDQQFHRATVHSTQYSNIKKLCWTNEEGEEVSTNKSNRRTTMLEIVRTNRHADFLVQFPQFTQLYEETAKEYLNCANALQTVYSSLPREDRKEFAKAASRYKWKKFLFEMFELTVTNVESEYLSIVSTDKLLEILNAKIS